MSIAPTVEKFLKSSGINYTLEQHDREVVATRIARSAHIPGESFAKSVLLKSDSGYMMAVVPSSQNVDLAELSHQLRERLGLATEDEIVEQFSDCDPGAVPGCGTAYGVPMIIDDALDRCADIYLEGGDHKTLIHLNAADFAKLTAGASRAHITHMQDSAPN